MLPVPPGSCAQEGPRSQQGVSKHFQGGQGALSAGHSGLGTGLEKFQDSSRKGCWGVRKRPRVWGTLVSPERLLGVTLELLGCLKQGRGLDYLVGRICPETRLRGQDTETSLVPSQQQGPGNGKCREARRGSSHAGLSKYRITPIPSNKYHRGQCLPIPVQSPTPPKLGQTDHASAQNRICLFLCHEQFIFRLLKAPTSLVMSSQTGERTPGISQQDKGRQPHSQASLSGPLTPASPAP